MRTTVIKFVCTSFLESGRDRPNWVSGVIVSSLKYFEQLVFGQLKRRDVV